MNRKLLALAAAAAAMIALASCQTMGVKQTPDEKAVARGVAAWNESMPSAARPYWNAIEDAAVRDRYLSYLVTFEAGSKALDDAAALKPADEMRILAAYQKAQAALTALPQELSLPPETTARASSLAEGRMRAHTAANRLTQARELGKTAIGAFGESEGIRSMFAEIDAILASRKRETGADAALETARGTEAFYDRIAAYDAAVSAFAKGETLLAEDAGKAGVAKSDGIAREASRLRKKRQDTAIERDKLLRERAYSFKDRIGEEFARAPEGRTVGSMTLEEVLAHQESVQANVDAVYQEMREFASRYPRSIDADMIREVEDQKKDLDAKIAQVNAEIRTAREIASRGKIAMPVMIGLFNPQPGSAEESRKSRPATFGANGAKKAEYWWGMVSIPRGAMNDLVVTVSDSRTMRVFAENTKSGSLIVRNGIKDLVNRGYKVGNSWPVLNAGSQLTSDKYFFEVQPGKTPDYTGEVVVYSSFIMRMR
ncbi:MAG: hypothetical protein NTU62_00110 [Spirochaetes bacterium]|nr:hypothetical protein [Spirochaetota bacterium]